MALLTVATGSLLEKLRETGRLVMIQHTVFALPFAVIALVSTDRGPWLPPGVWWWVGVAMVSARTAAMAFNRLVDHRFDMLNPRTVGRSLPAGEVGELDRAGHGDAVRDVPARQGLRSRRQPSQRRRGPAGDPDPEGGRREREGGPEPHQVPDDAAEPDDLKKAVAQRLGIPVDSFPVRNLQWLGMFGTGRIKGAKMCPLDVLGTRMFQKLAFRPGERDLLVLFHDFEVAYPDGRREHITSTMVDYGIPGGDSAMSRTVSLPAAIGVQLILTGKLTTPGVLRPVTEDVYKPVLDELATMNIECKEKTEAY